MILLDNPYPNLLKQQIESLDIPIFITLIMLFLFQALLFWIPSEQLFVVSQLLYGEWIGTMICFVGLLFSSLLNFLLMRFLCLGITYQFPHSWIIRQKAYLRVYGGITLFCLRLLPIACFDVVSLLSGATIMRFSSYIFYTSIGILFFIILSFFIHSALLQCIIAFCLFWIFIIFKKIFNPSSFHIGKALKAEFMYYYRGDSPYSPPSKQKQRFAICLSCTRLTRARVCKECGCFMNIKICYKEATCPLKKWD
ncbi:VTT domain-containing protein [Helicobacter monodelphidis]|uniref:VTT domain-containing protein n=1 Tax=Helicobacter sp. 15-1451 TaxID=2004995 RepID=UPI0015ECA31C|nr:VTT domain-containing protein [Helicobacter sp. 15-1451]